MSAASAGDASGLPEADPLARAEESLAQARAQLLLGEVTQAEERLREVEGWVGGLPGARVAGLRAEAFNQRAGVRAQQGHWTEGMRLAQSALRLYEEVGDAAGQLGTLSNLAQLYLEVGQRDHALATLLRAYRLYEDHALPESAALSILHTVANLHHENGQADQAVRLMEDALERSVQAGNRLYEAGALGNLGLFLLRLGDHRAAREHLERALSMSRELGYRPLELAFLDTLGALCEEEGDPASARAAYEQILDLTAGAPEPETWQAHLRLGYLAHAAGERAQAAAHWEGVTQAGSEAQTSRVAQAYEGLIGLRRLDDPATALRYAEELRALECAAREQERERSARNLNVQFELERVRHEAEVYRLTTELEQEARRRAEAEVQRRTAELAAAQQEVMNRLAAAAEFRDDSTGEHTRRVGQASTLIALRLGWTKERAAILGTASRLHDVGKIGVPDRILLKPGRLEPDELAQMQRHVTIGARILSGGDSELLRLAEEIALSHHERWDGGGYPLGLRGEEIPLSGRIVAVADVFDALLQERPYKSAWTVAQALEEIGRQAGQQFDPRVVAAALDVLPQLPLDDSDGLAGATLSFAGRSGEEPRSFFERLLQNRTRELERARREAEAEASDLRRLALTDELTGLGNRRAFELAVDSLTHHLAAHPGLRPTVVSFDLDDLKAVNDHEGHEAGDRLLLAFARGFQEAFAGLGPTYRIGGDEFAVLSTRSWKEAALRECLARVGEVVGAAGFVGLTASMGSARYPGDGETLRDLLRVSDRRMYADKLRRRRGRRRGDQPS